MSRAVVFSVNQSVSRLWRQKMERIFKYALALIIAGYFCSLSVRPALASGSLEVSDEDMVASVRAIVTGRVTRIESRWDSRRNAIFTDITIAVSKVLKGSIASDNVIIEEPG